jgi:hypothetical protein
MPLPDWKLKVTVVQTVGGINDFLGSFLATRGSIEREARRHDGGNVYDRYGRSGVGDREGCGR